MRKKLIPFLIAILLFVCCTKEGNTIYQVNPDEEQPSTAPLVTVIYGPNSLGDRSYCDKIYKGVEASASKRGLYNYTNFGNLYTTSPKDFFVKRK